MRLNNWKTSDKNEEVSTVTVETTNTTQGRREVTTSYLLFVFFVVDLCWRYQWKRTALVIGTLLCEPYHAFKAGFLSPLGWLKQFRFYDLNPISLTPEQVRKRPILLIHGFLHNQSAWLSLAKRLSESDLGPVYTVNLPHDEINGKHLQIVSEKIDHIKSQYHMHQVTDVKIVIIGHSRGGKVAMKLAWNSDEFKDRRYAQYAKDIAYVIKLGSVLHELERALYSQNDPSFHNSHFELMGRYDLIERKLSLCPETHQAVIDAGHLSLLYSEQSQEQIIRWLLDNDKSHRKQ